MKFIKYSTTIFVTAMLVAAVSMQSYAQDQQYSDAVTAFNQALDFAQSNQFDDAIQMYNQALSLAEESQHESANDIIQRVERQLPTIYLQNASAAYRNFQNSSNLSNLDAAIESFRQAVDVADDFGNQQISQRASGIITQLLYQKSILQYQADDHAAAIASLDQAIERNSNYTKAYYQKGIVLKNQDSNNLDEALAMFDRAIEVGTGAGNDAQTARQARNAARDELIYRGVTAKENRSFNEAINYLNRALDYDNQSADAYYRLAEVANLRANWSEAVTNARQALELASGGSADLAKIYFELGTGLKGVGEVSEACSAFENASYGSFTNSAQHEIEFELDCE